MNVKVITLNSFALESGGGNPAGVVLDSSGLSEAQMLEIAKKVGFSETAFVMESDKSDFRVRFFTPEAEVDLCGHATIGAFHAMYEKGIIKPGRYSQETLAGILSVEIRDDGTIMMAQNQPELSESIEPGNQDYDKVCRSLGISSECTGIKNYVADIEGSAMTMKYVEGPNILQRMQVVSTGLRDLIIPVESLESLRSIKPDYELITELSRKYDITGYHVFTLETEDENNTAQCRNFAPLFGIDEESATGTSSGALAGYLYENNLKSRIRLNGTINMKFEQGYTMDRKSLISTSLDLRVRAGETAVEAVRVGGKAMDLEEITVKL